MAQRFANSPLIMGLAFVGSVVIAFMVTTRYALPHLAVGLPALHGALTAKSALQSPPSTPTNPRNITLELICAGWLGLAFLIPLIGRGHVFGLLLGWSVAAITTLVLVISTALDLGQKQRHPGPQGATRIRLTIQSCTLVVYSLLVLWMAVVVLLWLAVWLSGEPYMGQ